MQNSLIKFGKGSMMKIMWAFESLSSKWQHHEIWK